MFLQKVIVYLGWFSLIAFWHVPLSLNGFLVFKICFLEVLVEILKITQKEGIQNHLFLYNNAVLLKTAICSYNNKTVMPNL